MWMTCSPSHVCVVLRPAAGRLFHVHEEEGTAFCLVRRKLSPLSLSPPSLPPIPSWSFDLARPVFSLSFIDWSFLFFFLFTRSEKSKVPARRQRPEERKVRAVAWLFLSVAVSQFGWVPAGRFGPPRRKLVLLLPGAEISRL